MIGRLGVDDDGDPAPGLYRVSVAPANGGDALADVLDRFTPDAGPPSAPGDPVVTTFQTRFDIATAGDYQLEVLDHGFPALPAALQVIAAVISPSGDVVASFPDPPGPLTFTAAAGQYEVIAIATGEAGLYSVNVSGPSGVVLNTTQRAGAVQGPRNVNVPAAGVLDVKLTDANVLAELTTFQVAAVQSGALRGVVAGDVATPIANVAPGALELYTHAAPSGVGAFTVRATQGASVVVADVIAVDGSADAAGPAIYVYEPSAPVAAGAHRLVLQDLRFPAAFAEVEAVVFQADQILGRVEAGDGPLNVTLQAGHTKAIVATQFSGAVSAGMYAVQLLQQPSGSIAFESTQGVGGAFRTHAVTVPTSGPYDVTLVDLNLPTAARTNALAITSGVQMVGQIFGGGVLPRQQLAAGPYVLNLLVQPAANQQNGAYALKVADSPLAPTVTLTATPASLTSGERSTLQWTVANAASCLAEEGWTGQKAATGGSEQTAPLSANATFRITCTGPGGSATATASVTVNPPAPNRRSGGGGAAGGLLLIYMCGLAALRWGRGLRL